LAPTICCATMLAPRVIVICAGWSAVFATTTA
jgi:hypothetical protein